MLLLCCLCAQCQNTYQSKGTSAPEAPGTLGIPHNNKPTRAPSRTPTRESKKPTRGPTEKPDWRIAEEEILRQLYNATAGESWVNAMGWMDGQLDHCRWYGVNCVRVHADGESVSQL